MSRNRPFQAVPPETMPMTNDAFKDCNETSAYWMTSATVFVNSYGTTVMIDPNTAVVRRNPNGLNIAEIQDMELLRLAPIMAPEIKKLDAVLYTHADDDHLGVVTALQLLPTGCMYHGTEYVGRALENLGIPRDRIVIHKSGDAFQIGNISVELTPAYHPWQLQEPEKYDGWHYALDDCCGYRLITRDGIIWDPGDSLLLPEHLTYNDVDLAFMDFSDSKKEYHFGEEDALKIAAAMPLAEIIVFHWGTFYAPQNKWCSGDPAKIMDKAVNPTRIHILAPGEKFVLKKH